DEATTHLKSYHERVIVFSGQEQLELDIASEVSPLTDKPARRTHSAYFFAILPSAAISIGISREPILLFPSSMTAIRKSYLPGGKRSSWCVVTPSRSIRAYCSGENPSSTVFEIVAAEFRYLSHATVSR